MKFHKNGVDRWLFNVGATLGALCLVLAAMTLVFGLKPLIFTSGSMAPAIPTGALAFAVPAAADEVSAGDVVSVVSSDGVRVTHRVVAADPASGLVLKGDANAVADLQQYTGASVDRVLFSVPGLGYVASWLASPWLFGLGGLLCAYLIYVAFFRRGSGSGSGADSVADSPKSGTRRRTWLGAGAIVTALALMVPLGMAAQVEATQAAWTANAAAGSPVAAGTLAPPGNLKCQASGTGNQAVNITWSAPADGSLVAARYKIGVTVNGANKEEVLAGTSKVLSLDENKDGLLGGVVNLLGGLLELLLGGAKAVDVTVVAVHSSGWESPAAASGLGIATISRPLLPLLGPPVIKCK